MKKVVMAAVLGAMALLTTAADRPEPQKGDCIFLPGHSVCCYSDGTCGPINR